MSLRVLQVVDTPDPSRSVDAALALHEFLVANGCAVRTLAFGSATRSGASTEIPPMGPSPRSLASLLQFRRESAWADAVLVRSGRPGPSARFARAPLVWCVDDQLSPRRVPKRVVRVVVPSERVGVGFEPSTVLAPVVADVAHTSPAARSAARRLLGVADSAVVVTTTNLRSDAAQHVAAEVAGIGGVVVGFAESTAVGGPEVVRAAADVVVFGDSSWLGAPVEAVRAVFAGAVPFEWDDAETVVSSQQALRTLLAARHDGALATEQARGVSGLLRSTHGAATCGARWLQILAAAADHSPSVADG